MIGISILYPNKNGARFNVNYFAGVHMPKSIDLVNAHPGFRGVSVDFGFAGAVPGKGANFVAMCHFMFDTVDSMMEAFHPHVQWLRTDMTMYTDIEPIVQVNEVLFSS